MMNFHRARRCLLLVWTVKTLCVSSVSAQNEGWWRSLFKPKSEPIDVHAPAAPDSATTPVLDAPKLDQTTTAPSATLNANRLDSTRHTDALNATPKDRVHAPGVLRVEHTARLDTLDSLWRLNPPPLRGFRIQVYLGNLNDSRAERARLRRQTDAPIYLEAMPPNYGLMVGDFRDKWRAEAACAQWKTTHPAALVIPSQIKPAPLPERKRESEAKMPPESGMD